jgi:hypothetical protein
VYYTEEQTILLVFLWRKESKERKHSKGSSKKIAPQRKDTRGTREKTNRRMKPNDNPVPHHLGANSIVV